MIIKTSFNSRADLLRWAISNGKGELNDIAFLLGYEVVEIDSENSPREDNAENLVSQQSAEQEQQEEIEQGFKPELAKRYYYINHRQAILRTEQETMDDEWGVPPSIQNIPAFKDDDPVLQIPNNALPPLPRVDIAPVARINPFLRQKLIQQGPLRLDLDSLIKKVSYLQPLYQIPKTRKKIPAGHVTILLDLNDRLVPFWEDCHRLCEFIVQKHGRLGLDIRDIRDEPEGKHGDWYDDELPPEKWALPASGSVVFILSDLGQLAHDGGAIIRSWLRLGKRLKQQGISPTVLTPLAQAQYKPELREFYQQTHWDRGIIPISSDQNQLNQQLIRLLGLLSPAVNIESELLRAICRLLPADQSHSGMEAAIWTHPDIRTGYSLIQFKESKRGDYLKQFAIEPAVLQKQVLSLIKQHHAGQFPGVWARELLFAAEIVNFPVQEMGDIVKAEEFFRRVTRSLYQQPGNHGLALYGRREIERLSEKQMQQQNQAQHKYQSALYTLAYQDLLRNREITLPNWVDPSESMAVLNAPKTIQNYQLIQRGEELFLRLETAESESHSKPGSTLLQLQSAQAGIWVNHRFTPIHLDKSIATLSAGKNIKIHTGIEKFNIDSMTKPRWLTAIGQNAQGLYQEINDKEREPQRHWWHPPDLDMQRETWHPPMIAREQRGFLHPNPPGQITQPQWATAMGRDQYGLYADFTFKGIDQRMRWIEAGHFLMGSPEDEPERYDDEVQHSVTLSQGFWLADTTVIQTLWQAVMGENPSDFKGDLNPVENVSWNDAQEFIKKLNREFGVQFALPGEAQWEYACRAGTETPFSFGKNISSELVNYDGQRPYNQGKKSEKRGKTVEVKSLPCNAWGLYEMHGNVWEWCQDSWQEDMGAESVIDPKPANKGENRVRRGGSWFNFGGFVRSAFRFHDSPDYRNYFTGFRLSLGQ